MFAAALEAFGRVDAVLNVAGIGGAEPVHKVTMAEYDRIMDVDLRGVLLGTKHGIRAMRDPFTAKPYVLFYTTKRVGGGVQDFNAIKLLKFTSS